VLIDACCTQLSHINSRRTGHKPLQILFVLYCTALTFCICKAQGHSSLKDKVRGQSGSKLGSPFGWRDLNRQSRALFALIKTWRYISRLVTYLLTFPAHVNVKSTTLTADLWRTADTNVADLGAFYHLAFLYKVHTHTHTHTQHKSSSHQCGGGRPAASKHGLTRASKSASRPHVTRCTHTERHH